MLKTIQDKARHRTRPLWAWLKLLWSELRKVLAHEMGHALGLEHVEDPGAVMYYLMEGAVSNVALHDSDIAEYKAVCGAK